MPIPILIPIAIAAAGVGGINLASGTTKNKQTKRLTADIQLALCNAQDKAERAQKEANKSLTNLGQIKFEVLDTTINRFLSTINKIHNVEFNSTLLIDGQNQYNIDKQALCDMQQLSSVANSVLKGVIGGAGTGALAAFGAYSATALLGTASTGTSIATLSGIAAQNATLAFLGGGTLAAGGGGIAAGLAGLGGLAAGAVVAILGISVNLSATKNLNNAYANLAQVEEAVVGMETITMLCEAILQKTDMFSELLHNLNELLIKCLNDLNTVIVSSGNNYSNYTVGEKAIIARTLSVVSAIKAVLDTPILDDDGNITDESEVIYGELNSQYRQMIGSSQKSDFQNQENEENSQKENLINRIKLFLRAQPGDGMFKDNSKKGKKFEASVSFKLSYFQESTDDIIGLYDPTPMHCLTGNISGILFCNNRFLFKQTPNDTPVSLKYSEIKDLKQTFSYLHFYGKNGIVISMKGVSFASDEVYFLFKEIMDCCKE